MLLMDADTATRQSFFRQNKKSSTSGQKKTNIFKALQSSSKN